MNAGVALVKTWETADIVLPFVNIAIIWACEKVPNFIAEREIAVCSEAHLRCTLIGCKQPPTPN